MVSVLYSSPLSPPPQPEVVLSFLSLADHDSLSISKFAQTQTQMAQTLSISRFSLSQIVVSVSQIGKSLSFLSPSFSSVVQVDLWVCGVC